MRKLLTDSFCKSAPIPQNARAEWSDVRCVGLEFRVTQAGARSWSFRFRNKADGKPLRAGIGPYPEITLSRARQMADELRSQAANGINPIEQKRQQRLDASAKTFDVLADRYMNEHARRHKRPLSAEGDDRNLRVHVLPKWGKRDFRKLRRADVVELIESIVAAGTPTAANRVHALVSKIFSFAMDADLLDANPAARLRKRGVEARGKRVLSDTDLRMFWPKVVLSPVSRRIGLALRLALLTGARANEVAGIRREELQHLEDDERAAWVVPAERSKNKREHLIPLSAMARDVIRSALELCDVDECFVFPSPKKRKTPITRHALAVAMSRFCDTQAKSSALSLDPPSPHDLRRTFGTRLSALGVAREDRDACLNHKRNDVGSHYDLYEREKEKRAAVTLLSDSIASILAGANGGRNL